MLSRYDHQDSTLAEATNMTTLTELITSQWNDLTAEKKAALLEEQRRRWVRGELVWDARDEVEYLKALREGNELAAAILEAKARRKARQAQLEANDDDQS